MISHIFLLKLSHKVVNAHILSNILQKYFEKHPGSSSGGVRSEADCLEDLPIDSFPVEKVSEEMSQVSNLIGLFLKDVVVPVEKGLQKEFLVLVINSAEPLGKQPEETLVYSLHHAALQNHIHQLVLIPLCDVHLQYFMSAFLEIDSRLDRQIYCLSQVYQVLLS